MIETCREKSIILNKLNKCASRWFHYTDLIHYILEGYCEITVAMNSQATIKISKEKA
jgi:hypothetical protein